MRDMIVMGGLRRYIPVLVMGFTLTACNFPIQVADEIAREKDAITLKVNGVPYTFDGGGDDEGHFLETDIILRGISGSNMISLYLKTGEEGTYYLTTGVSASWNRYYTLPGSGFVTIAENSNEISFVSGTFAFMAIGAISGDTISVTDGKFHVHYNTGY